VERSRVGAADRQASEGCGGYRLLFHDTHHRPITESQSIAAYDLSGYDGVLAHGKAIADVYAAQSWARRVWVWHEAADSRVFHPCPDVKKDLDLVWIGNWGDDERSAELDEFLLRPVKALKLKARAYGVRYPDAAVKALSECGNRVPWLAGQFPRPRTVRPRSRHGSHPAGAVCGGPAGGSHNSAL
jgi:spore maturation protein CgeB